MPSALTAMKHGVYFFRLYPYLLVGGAVFLFLFSLFYMQTHNIDISAFLYLGSRLSRYGEWLYLNDFETKLPFVQYVFALASQLGGIGSWRIMVFIWTATVSYAASVCMIFGLSEKPVFSELNRRSTLWFLWGLFLIVLYSLPGASSGQLEIPAAAAAYYSLALVSVKWTLPGRLYVAYLGAGVLFAIATLFRPNYGYVFVLFICTILVLSTRESRRQTWTGVLLFGCGYVGIIALSFAPYWWSSERLTLLIDGLLAIHTFPITMSIEDILFVQFWYLPTKFLYIAMGLIMVGAYVWWRYYGCHVSRVVPLSLVGIIGMEISIFQTHYFPHYTMMFVPYVVPLFFLMMGGVQPITWHNKILYKLMASGVFILLLIYPSGYLITEIRTLLQHPDRIVIAVNDRRLDHRLLSYLSTLQQAKLGFLVIYEPVYHRLLGESRIGDGHPSMLRDVLRGKHIGPVGELYLYSAEAHRDPCSVFFHSDKQIFVMTKQQQNMPRDKRLTERLAAQCFTDENFETSTFIGERNNQYLIYIRK